MKYVEYEGHITEKLIASSVERFAWDAHEELGAHVVNGFASTEVGGCVTASDCCAPRRACRIHH